MWQKCLYFFLSSESTHFLLFLQLQESLPAGDQDIFIGFLFQTISIFHIVCDLQNNLQSHFLKAVIDLPDDEGRTSGSPKHS